MINLNPIGVVCSTRQEVKDDQWDAEESFINLDAAQFSPEVLDGIEDFSHAEVIFFMDKVNVEKISLSSRYPRNNTDWPKVGIFAQRGKNRPNQIGLTVCKIVKRDGLKLYLQGLDAVDGTPVIDIKPWVEEFAPRGQVTQPKWISELMKEYWS